MAVIDSMFPRWFINKKTLERQILHNIRERDEAGDDWITVGEYYGLNEPEKVKPLQPQTQPKKPEEKYELLPQIEQKRRGVGHPIRKKMQVRPDIEADKIDKMEFMS
jgi:hypothetical protein